ncbi:MAG: DUF932 domain-containing protein [Ignavibacteriae bacterium]|nr:DUF932 domain-containing protein [Ignavibacteriota bacterium]
MNRITDINSIDFPVRLDSVFIRNSKKRKYKEAIGFKAVTGKTDGREKIFSLVTDNYSLITNKQALELGRKIFREYFSKESEINLSVFNVTFPETRSFCNIDLMNNLYSFNVWEKEVYIPFMRITNSYNRTKALKFEIGFSRKWCDNGVIFEKETVSLNYIHYKKPVSEIMKDFKPGEKIDKLRILEEKFTQLMIKLREEKIDRKYFVPLTAKIFELKFKIESDNRKLREREIKRMNEFVNYCEKLGNKYSYLLGNSAYAVFNVATELANNRDFVKSHRYNDYQTKAGKWLKAFVNRKENNSLEEYLKDYKYLINFN